MEQVLFESPVTLLAEHFEVAFHPGSARTRSIRIVPTGDGRVGLPGDIRTGRTPPRSGTTPCRPSRSRSCCRAANRAVAAPPRTRGTFRSGTACNRRCACGPPVRARTTGPRARGSIRPASRRPPRAACRESCGSGTTGRRARSRSAGSPRNPRSRGRQAVPSRRDRRTAAKGDGRDEWAI